MKVALDLPAHPLTADDFAALPEVEGFRPELWEGNIVLVAAGQFGWHSWVVDQLVDLFRQEGLGTLREVGVRLGPRDVPNPDVMVLNRQLTEADLTRSQFAADEVTRVVDVLSEESRDRDTIAKPAKYAAAGIPEFWLVERHPTGLVDAIVSIFKLTPAGSYEIAGKRALSAMRKLSL